MVRQRLTLPLPALAPPGERPRVLLHGVSMGEIKASESIVRSLEGDGYDVVVSASTDTGVEIANRLFPHLSVVRFPVDHLLPVGRFLRRVRPAAIVLMELEMWPNFVRRASRLGVPIAIVNGRLTSGSYENYRRFGRTLFQFDRVSLFAAQVETYAERFVTLGGAPERVVIAGNVKFDGLRIGPPPRDEEFVELERLAGGRPGQAVVVAGSTHEPEERWVTRAWRRAAPDARLILVPRHPERVGSVGERLAAEGVAVQRLTDLRVGRQVPDPERPLLVDTIGELGRVYGLADLVFVGGSLIPHGGQNMLEPAAQGRPVLFGPHVSNFPVGAPLLEGMGAARRVEDPDELARAIGELLADPEARARMAAAGMRAIEQHRGATARTLTLLRERCLPEPPPAGQG